MSLGLPQYISKDCHLTITLCHFSFSSLLDLVAFSFFQNLVMSLLLYCFSFRSLVSSWIYSLKNLSLAFSQSVRFYTTFMFTQISNFFLWMVKLMIITLSPAYQSKYASLPHIRRLHDLHHLYAYVPVYSILYICMRLVWFKARKKDRSVLLFIIFFLSYKKSCLLINSTDTWTFDIMTHEVTKEITILSPSIILSLVGT